MQLRHALLVLGNEAVGEEDDEGVLEDAGNVVEDAEEEQPDGDELDDGNRAADVVGEPVVWVLVRRQCHVRKSVRQSVVEPAMCLPVARSGIYVA